MDGLRMKQIKEHDSLWTLFIMSILSTFKNIGLMIEFTRDDVICRSDGTRRISEPGTEENLTCIVVFCLVYFMENVWSLYLLKVFIWLNLRYVFCCVQTKFAKESLLEMHLQILKIYGPNMFKMCQNFLKNLVHCPFYC